jgi:hypothetical protein
MMIGGFTMHLFRSHMPSSGGPYSRNPHGTTRGWQPCSPAHAQHVRPHRHTQPVNGWVVSVVPADVMQSNCTAASYSSVHGHRHETTAPQLACALHTPRWQPCSPREHPNAKSILLGLVYEHRGSGVSTTSHTGAPNSKVPTQHSHHTSTCACTAALGAAIIRQ